MNVAGITRESGLLLFDGTLKALGLELSDRVPEKSRESRAPSRFPPSVASHPAFTRKFNAKLVAVGMAATNGHRRMGVR